MAHYQAQQRAARMRPKHYVEYALLRLVILAFRPFSLGASLWIARRLGDLAFSVFRIRRQVLLENLRTAFGDEYSEPEYRKIARQCYHNFAMTFVEILRFNWETLSDIQSRMDFTGIEHVQAAVERGKGVIYLAGHVGNWELMGACLGMLGAPLSVVQGDQKNLFVDRLMKGLRKRMGMELIPIGSSLKMVLKTLRNNGRIALIADQDGGRDGVFVEYFGRLASTPSGPARFALKTGAAVVVGLDRRTEGARHLGQFSAPIVPDPDAPEEDEVRRIVKEYTRALEVYVRENPAEWFWMHRRWKTRPPGVGGGTGGEASAAG